MGIKSYCHSSETKYLSFEGTGIVEAEVTNCAVEEKRTIHI